MTWELERRPCYFVGNGQAGRLVEVTPPDPNDPVIEGKYSDYIVGSLFATDYTYSHFNDSMCSTVIANRELHRAFLPICYVMSISFP